MGELNFFNIEKNTIIKITKLRVQTPFGPLKHSLILKCESVTQDFSRISLADSKMRKQLDQKLKMQSMLTVCFTGFYFLPTRTNKSG